MKGQTVNTFSSVGHWVSVTSIHVQPCCSRAPGRHIQNIKERAWLCSNETLFRKTSLDQDVAQPAAVCNPSYRRMSVFVLHTEHSPQTVSSPLLTQFTFSHLFSKPGLFLRVTQMRWYISLLAPNFHPSLYPCPFSYDLGIPPIKVKCISRPSDFGLSHVTCSDRLPWRSRLPSS